jgi:hypothetical protein
MNAIVYSIYVEGADLCDNYNFEQFKTSFKTLRKFNKELPVKVYLCAPSATDLEQIYSYNDKNLEFILFNLSIDERLTGGIYARWTGHKWPNTIAALKTFEFDNVLYIDTDTFFQTDPAYLFDKYGYTDSIIGKEEGQDKWTKKFNHPYLGMNDGQQLVSKLCLPYLKDLIKYRDDAVYKLQEENKDNPDKEFKIAIQYVYGQYAVSDFLISIGNPLKQFDDSDVTVISYPDKFYALGEKKDSICLLHYFNTNMEIFDPAAYEVYRINNLNGSKKKT